MAKKSIAKKARTFDNGVTVGVAVIILMVGIKQGWFPYHIVSWELTLVPITLFWRVPFLLILAYFDEENSQYYLEYLWDYLVPASSREE